ncbi:hypothetical protein [Capnocytophaga catalasegens]|uniref:Uncharacterized protein n=1 Tax=Capnocytophaga catalasegens TaxID=1004260 RepID=A0AAV5B074_9FLAO|nr:hypothetical protein [Capnocytophaga catalasegens]GIZ16531.1 hypothetical protein RCZ03_25310 [Capnocytophaga catalasegens]GJM51548.1 hypothetical protein RCZ15_25210 [Capnocytophaga catalasegens]GJM52878.1 hypothetical protein RCZ16_11950 [Capnocytophaga catalasegens]
MMNGVVLAKRINSFEPLNRFRKSKEIVENIFTLNVQERINLLVFSFKNYDKSYNKSLCLTYPNLWNEFNEDNWKSLIIEMFPREINIIKNDLRIINTGKYFDVFLLNTIIGISPFRLIFNELSDNDENKVLFNFLNFYGEVYFFYNEN